MVLLQHPIFHRISLCMDCCSVWCQLKKLDSVKSIEDFWFKNINLQCLLSLSCVSAIYTFQFVHQFMMWGVQHSQYCRNNFHDGITKIFWWIYTCMSGFKSCVCYIFANLFFKSKWKLGKSFFISLQKLFLFLRKSNFRILDFQISWRHQMPKHKIMNAFNWITWEVNTVF